MPLRWYSKLILEKYYFVFSVTSNRDFGKFLQIISQRISVTLQTNFLMMNYWILEYTTQQPEAAVDSCSVKDYSEKIHKN